MKMLKCYEDEQRALQTEAEIILNELLQEETHEREAFPCHCEEVHRSSRTDTRNPP